MRTVRLRLFVAAAHSIADRASAPSFEADIARPMTRREKRSSTGATWSHPSSVRGNFTPVTLAAARHFKHAAERGDGKVRALDLNEREPPGLCFAKNFAAVFRISRSISSCLFSRRRRTSSARSSLVSAASGALPAFLPASLPAALSARYTQSRSAVLV